MKRSLFAILGGAALLGAGCLVTSVYPFYTAKDVQFEPALLGKWSDTKTKNEHWQFEQQGDKHYQLTYSEGTNAPYTMQATFFKMKGESFLDAFTTKEVDVQPPPIPSHFLLRVLELKPNLRMAPLDYDWLQKTLAENPKALRHCLTPPDEKPENQRLVLTADTAELQKFVLAHLNTRAAWTNETELSRDSLAQR